MGNEAWCASQQSNAFTYPGWDITPDGQQLAAQVIQSGDVNQPVSSIEALNLLDNSTTALLAQLPGAMLAHDLLLTWGPDSQTIVATEAHLFSQDGPYSASLADPAAMQSYMPGAAGQVAWKSDSSAFVLQSSDMADVTDAAQIYLFNTGDTHGQLLLTGARDFVWG
ncbi:MAG TPA: hypothetical protein VKR83_00390, partial [Ktedonobacteraceae bacterium]|nr:hypothetical protein [Ktedonobacteraceae bacterium]